MKIKRIFFYASIAALAACKVEVNVPAGGSVATISGSLNCPAESTCTQDVADIYFDETYVATPDSGYDFLAWKSGDGRLCGGLVEPCHYLTAGLEGHEDFIELLDAQSIVVSVDPVFVSEGAEPEERLGATLDCPWDEGDPTLHVFFAAGQSNMVSAYGRPGTLPVKYETGTDRLQMWDEGSWKRLGLSTENGNHVPRYGPELSFAWTLHAACPDSNIGIIKYAVGGSLISTWVPGGENLDLLYANIIAAYRAHPDITFEGFLYKQGAADANRRHTAEIWGDNFLSIVDFFRNIWLIPDELPFLVGTTRGTADAESFPDDITDFDPDSVPAPGSRPFMMHLIHQQWMVQFERPAIYPVIDRDIPVGADETHHSPEGIRMVGRKFAEVYLKEAN